MLKTVVSFSSISHDQMELAHLSFNGGVAIFPVWAPLQCRLKGGGRYTETSFLPMEQWPRKPKTPEQLLNCRVSSKCPEYLHNGAFRTHPDMLSQLFSTGMS